ncbi:MAG: hypothetical protein ACRBF0_15990 [Calditrichia bacterium]
MFKISSLLETENLLLLKVEGEITLDQLSAWNESLVKIFNSPIRRLVIDFCSITYLSVEAIELLIDLISPNVLILNCTTLVGNMLKSAGLSENLLDSTKAK